MFQDDTRIIVVSPVYNGENWVGKCVQSVQSQTFGNYVHVVVDDNTRVQQRMH